MDTRQLTRARIAQSRPPSYMPTCPAVAFICCVAVPLAVLYTVQGSQPQSQQPRAIVENVKPLEPIGGSSRSRIRDDGGRGGTTSAMAQQLQAAAASTSAFSSSSSSSSSSSAATQGAVPEHESSQPMAI